MISAKTMKKAVMYGGGNIGRGFIAQLFYLSGYETVFIDVNDDLVNNLNSQNEYPIFITKGEIYERFDVKNVRAINGRNAADVAAEIANCDIMATAVGVNILKFIAKNIAEGVALRAKSGTALNIIICENKIDADKYLRTLIASELSDDTLNFFNEKVGLIEASIGRMVSATPDVIKNKYPLAVCVEPYMELPVDKKGFRGDIPEIFNMKPSEPFELFIRRKLFMHNMSHALISYLGFVAGYEYIWEAAGDPRIRFIALSALIESSCALSREYCIDAVPLIQFTFELLSRFDNKLLSDTIERVGRDTKRKLASEDRIVGAISLCKKNSLPCIHIISALAAGLMFSPDGDESSREIHEFTQRNGVKAALEEYCKISDDEIITKVEELYSELVLNRMININ